MERDIIGVLRAVEEYIDDTDIGKQPLRVALSGEWWQGTERRLYTSQADADCGFEGLTIEWVYPTDVWGEVLESLLDDLHYYLREMRRADRERSKD